MQKTTEAVPVYKSVPQIAGFKDNDGHFSDEYNTEDMSGESENELEANKENVETCSDSKTSMSFQQIETSKIQVFSVPKPVDSGDNDVHALRYAIFWL